MAIMGISNIGYYGLNGSVSSMISVVENYERQLQHLGVPDDIIAGGYYAIRDYAAKNGILLPTSPSQSQMPQIKTTEKPELLKNNSMDALKSSLLSLGIPQSVINQGIVSVQTFAARKNISLPMGNVTGSLLNTVI